VIDDGLLAASVEQTGGGDPDRQGEFTVSKGKIALAGFQLLRVAQKIVNDYVGWLESGKTGEKQLHVTLGIVISDTGIENFHPLPIGLEHLLKPRRHRIFFFHTPSESYGGAQKEDPSQIGLFRCYRTASQAQLVGSDVHRLQDCRLILVVFVPEDGVGAHMLQLPRVAPHLYIVVLHRAVLEPQQHLGEPNCDNQRAEKYYC
jgi:hypothetical protein